MIDKKELGQKLRAIRLEKKMSLRQMAHFLNTREVHDVWNKQRVGNLERGVGNASLSKFIEIFGRLGVEIKITVE